MTGMVFDFVSNVIVLRCQPNWFRCTYGACVDGTAPCNGKSECADDSDELMPSCRNETNEAQ